MVPQLLGISDTDPVNYEELEMYMNYTWKSRAAIEIESALDLILTTNRYPDLKELIYKDLYDWGITGIREYADYDGEIIVEHVNPMDAIVGYTSDPFFSKLEYAGQVKELTLAELHNLLRDEDKGSEDWENLIQSLAVRRKMTNRHNRIRNDLSELDGIKVQVLHLEFISTNKKRFDGRITKNGVLAYGADKKGEQEIAYDVVYEGYWVIDTDFFFGCKLSTNMKRDPRALKKTSLSYHFVAPDIYQMGAYSLGRQMIPIADAIQISWYKLQNVIARAKPKGIAIEATSLQDVPFGAEEISPQQIVNMYNYTGNLVYRRVNADGDVANWRPIDELDNGLGDEASRYWNDIQQKIQLLRDITGFNEITDGSTPNAKTLKSVAERASIATNNAIDYIYQYEKKLFERVASDLVLRIQDAAEDGTIEGYRNALGTNTVEFFKLNKDVSWRELGLFIEDDPTEEEKARLQQRIEIALANKEITVEDAVYVEDIKNKKQAVQYLAYRIKRKRELDEANAMAMQQQNGQIQQQSAMVAAEEERKTREADHMYKMAQIDREWQWRLQNTQVENQRFTNQEVIKRDARITEKQLDTESKEYLAGVKNQNTKVD